jgi:hypothetical protein
MPSGFGGPDGHLFPRSDNTVELAAAEKAFLGG